jgi:proline iminopeptidase
MHIRQKTLNTYRFQNSNQRSVLFRYAAKYPETVETLILRGIFIGRKEDLLYMYQGNAETFEENPFGLTNPGSYIMFPEAWRHFVEVIAPEKRRDMMGAYKEIFDMKPESDEEKELQQKAITAWSVWEGVISNLIPDMSGVGKFSKQSFAACFSQIEAHYFANDLFMKPGYLIESVPNFAHIPLHIVHGRYDQVCPLTQADTLVAALKKAGAAPANYVKTTAGHSMLERENYLALTKIMDNLPKMSGFDLKHPEPRLGAAPQPGVDNV